MFMDGVDEFFKSFMETINNVVTVEEKDLNVSANAFNSKCTTIDNNSIPSFRYAENHWHTHVGKGIFLINAKFIDESAQLLQERGDQSESQRNPQLHEYTTALREIGGGKWEYSENVSEMRHSTEGDGWSH